MLAKLNRIAAQLAKIESLEDAKSLRDKTEALRVYAKQQKASEEIERRIVVVRLRVERRIGELLDKAVRAGNPQLSNDTTIGLADVGISRDQSSRWQTVARLPDDDFEQFIETAPTKQLSTNSLIKAVREHERQEERHGPSRGQNVLTGDIGKLGKRLDDGSVDLILTDPPYADLDCYSKLCDLAADKLKDGGLCLCYSGQYHLPEVMSRMSRLEYYWMIAVRFAGPHNAIYPRTVQNKWKPLLCYAKGKPSHDWVVDHLEGGGYAKDLHIWQKPETESEYLIERLTDPGGLVVDPFVGSGTVLAAAKKLGRDFLGTELDPSVARMARRRLAA